MSATKLLLTVLGPASFFLFAVVLYVRPHLQARSVAPYWPIYDPYQHAYWLCLSPPLPHSATHPSSERGKSKLGFIIGLERLVYEVRRHAVRPRRSITSRQALNAHAPNPLRIFHPVSYDSALGIIPRCVP